MARNLVIVESPAKAKTIGKYIGKDYTVKASVGHIRDLPKNELGVDEETYIPKYVTLKGKENVVRDLRKAAKAADAIYIASDPDREGEAIGWHVQNILGKDAGKVRRVRFHEITKSAVQKALEAPTELDMNKVNAQQARRVLDRLVGYKLSPLLWDKVKRGLSAGRVQSVALKMIVDREREIEAFVAEEYWTIAATLAAQEPPKFIAKLAKVDGKKAVIENEASARAIESDLEQGSFSVSEIRKKEKTRRPQPPFTTSKLQQEAARRYRYPVRKTMSVAQSLYEGVELGSRGLTGLITYMRTDSMRVSDEAIGEVRDTIGAKFGPDHLPEKPNVYKSKKAAQEAHEAIRPSSMELDPESIRQYLSKDEYNLYRLIYERFLASQMKPALFDVTDVSVQNGNYIFKSSGEVLRFEGFLLATGEAQQLKEATDESGSDDSPASLPNLTEGQALERVGPLDTRQNFTQPPPRFTEATLVKALEENGIGRPSTYASILQTIQSRDYTTKDQGKFTPTNLGIVVTDLLQESFSDLINESYTAKLEDELDEIEEGKADWQKALSVFGAKFGKDLDTAEKKMPMVKTGIATEEKCETCGSDMVIKFGRYGEFLACSAYPECKTTREIGEEPGDSEQEEEIECDKCGKPMTLKRSRFGKFYACTGYPDCRNTKDPQLLKAGIDETPQPPCEKCGSDMTLKSGRYGPFYSCSAYPECRNIRKIGGEASKSASEPTGVKCPECGEGDIVSRQSRRGVFYACNRYPKCKFSLSAKPVPRPCPQCDKKFLVEKHLKREGHIEQCSDKECGYRAQVSEEVATS
ncbi:MAG: type I DNA topoisomerase [Acidobacteria bacterium]|nr:type I DNA topoisomerase [Acidobacteriota bacterium]